MEKRLQSSQTTLLFGLSTTSTRDRSNQSAWNHDTAQYQIYSDPVLPGWWDSDDCWIPLSLAAPGWKASRFLCGEICAPYAVAKAIRLEV